MRSLSALLALCLAISVSAQVPVDFTGHWRQQTDSRTQREMEVEQKDHNLRVKSVVTASEGARTLDVKYDIGGPATSYTGLDGDEFRSSVHWDGSALVFDTVEREDGSEIPQKAVWSLSADHNTLQVERQVTKSGKTTHSMVTYARQR